jgi:hypothetical protein
MQGVKRGNGGTMRHLRKRCQQRGVRKLDLETLLDGSDRVVVVSGGRVAITFDQQDRYRASRKGCCRWCSPADREATSAMPVLTGRRAIT